MTFLYATDLHGSEQKYEDILSFALEHNIKLIHLSADLLPKSRTLYEAQKSFINGFLKQYYEKAKSFEIELFAFFGNDDLYSLKKYFRQFGSLLDEQPKQFENYEFVAYPYVCDYSFLLKTACKLDYKGWERPFAEYGLDENLERINDLDDYFRNKGSIEDDLRAIKAKENTIFSCHMPPNKLCLDVCGNGARVGSRSVYDWIEDQQPLLALCGHIHESLNVTNVWKMTIGRTLVVQPGQMSRTRFVIFEIENSSITPHLIEI